MILDRKLVHLSPRFEVELPAGSVPKWFVNQSGNIYLWFESTSNPATEVFKFAEIQKGEIVVGEGMQMIKDGHYSGIYKV